MRQLLTITVTSYTLLGNIALAGIGSAAPAPLPEKTAIVEVNMSAEVNMSTEAPNTSAVLACKEQGERKAVQAPSTREACPTDRCIVAFDNQAKIEGVALLSGKQEVVLSAAIAPRIIAEQALGSVGHRTRVEAGRNLVATITSSVIFRE